MSGSQQTNKVSFDPGWNDPPPLSYSPQSQLNKPRNILNKRVAFPLSPAHTPPGIPGTAAPGLPPPPPFHQSPTTPLPPAHSNASEELAIDSEHALKKVTDALYGVLDNSSELGSKGLDIRKRIAIMEDMWKSGNLNTQIQHKMVQLAIAVIEERPRDADELHKALMVEHAGAVSAWMPAVRRLLHHNIARHELLAIDQHSD